MKTALKFLLLVLFVGIVGYTLFYLWSKDQSKPITYKLEKPFKTTIIQKAVATGSVVPRKEIDIKPVVSGIIEKLYVEAGKEIKHGDLIAKVKIIPDMVQLNNAENRVNQARIDVDRSQQDYDRNKSLFDQGVIAKSEFQRFEADLKSSKEELEAAENNLQLVKEGVTLKSSTTTNTLVRSTISGMVLDVPVEEGNSVIESNTFNEGTTIATIADLGEMIFEGKVDESEVGKIKQGMELIIKIGAIQNAVFNANLEYISPKGIEENGAIQFEIRAAMDLKEDFFIRAGYSANADIVLNRRDSVLAIKESLLQFKNDSIFVEVSPTGDQQFEKRFLQTGLSDGVNIEVVSGLAPDEWIKVAQDYGQE